MEAARLTAVIDSETAKGEAGMKRFGGLVNEAHGGLKNFIGSIGSMAGGMAVFSAVAGGAALVKDQLVGMVKSGMDANATAAQTAAVLKSTHGAAGVTADSVEKLSTQLMNLTGIDDDTVTSAQNMELTFTNIHKDVFPQVTKTALDMATALHENATDGAKQVSMALNDLDYTRLIREGVTFTDSQKKQLDAMKKSGDVAAGQKIILAELNKEFGGSAEAAGKANGGVKILTAQFDNMKQTIGQALIPVVTQLMAFVSSHLGPILEHVGPIIGIVSFQMEGLWRNIQFHVLPLFQTLGNLIGGTLSAIFGNFGHQTLEQTVAIGLNKVMGILFDLNQFIGDNVVPVVQKMADWWLHVGLPAVMRFAGFVQANVIPAIISLAQWIGANVIPIVETLADIFVSNVLPALASVWSALSKQLIPAVQSLWSAIGPALVPVLRVLGFVLGNVIGPAVGLVINGVSFLVNVVAAVITVAKALGGILFWLGEQIFKRNLQPGLEAVGNILSTVFKPQIDNARLAVQFLGDKIGDLLGLLGKAKDAIGGFLGGAGDALHNAGVPGFASGTNYAPGGPVLVGERGPELVNLPRGSTVLNASDTRAALAGGGNHTTVNIYPQHADMDVDALARVQKRLALLGSTGGAY